MTDRQALQPHLAMNRLLVFDGPRGPIYLPEADVVACRTRRQLNELLGYNRQRGKRQ